MIRHAPLAAGLVTVLCTAMLWWARDTNPRLVPGWLVLTAIAFTVTIALATITPGSSDE